MDPASYNMDVDDLFGDSDHVTLQTISAVAPLKGLARRVDELGASGCCQKIAWSKNGSLAYISPDGYSVHLKIFSRDTATGKWGLGKDVPVQVPQGRDNFPFVHLSWNSLGNDLAITDAAGRVIIFSCAIALDRMQFVRAELAHPEAEADGVVGVHWLAIYPHEAKSPIAWSADRDGKKWNWHIRSHVFQDAHHPIAGKASLIYLKRHGELRLRFQQNDNSWQEASNQLGLMLSTKEPFTHAAFASNNDNSLLLAAYDVERRLHLYRIEIVWNIPQDKQGQNAIPFDKPNIHVSLLAVEQNCGPVDISSDELDSGAETRGTAAALLTHLSFLPTTPEHNDGSLPTVQAIFCRPPNIISVDQINPQETPHSVVVKWTVHQTQQNQLHPSLDQVTSKKKSVDSVPARTTFLLKRAPDFTLHAVALAFYPVWYNMILAFCYNDGTIDFRKRSTMEPIMPDGNTDTVSSLLQSGFVFPHAEPSLHVALSPNHCMVACMQQDGTIKLRSMEYQHGSLSVDDTDPRNSAAVAALILQTVSSTYQYFSGDDIFSVMGTLTDTRKTEFSNLLFEGLQLNTDCGVDDTNTNHLMLLGRSANFVKMLSAVHLLGLQGPINRSLQSKMAWTILNMKYVTQFLTQLARMHGSLEKTLLRAELVPLFIGVCRWIMHFMAYMLDELFTLGRALEDVPPATLTREFLEQAFTAHNIPIVLLLLSAFPRAMIKLWAQPLAWVKRSAENFTNPHAPTPAPEIRKLYAPLQAAFGEIPFDWRWVERLVSETQEHARAAFRKQNMDDAQRSLVERELLLGKLPDVFVPVARRLVTDQLWNDKIPGGCLADKVDSGRLMFFDTTWLGLQESKRAAAWHDTHVVDVCQKTIIRGIGAQTHPSASPLPGRGRSESIQSAGGDERKKLLLQQQQQQQQQLRRCVRCGAYMEDITQGMPGYTPYHASWLMSGAKHCVCGSSWTLATEKRAR